MNDLSQLDANSDDPKIKDSIRNGQYQPLPLPAPYDKPLHAMDKICALWPGPLPDRHIQVYVGLPGKMSPIPLPVDRVPSDPLATAVTLITKSRGSFETPDTVEINNIHELDGTEPGFLSEFKSKLGQCRWIEPGTEVCLFRSHIQSNY